MLVSTVLGVADIGQSVDNEPFVRLQRQPKHGPSYL
jgi:hypothetical protein